MRKRSYLNALCIAAAVLLLGTFASAQPWTFGVMADTQWTVPDDGKNPYTVAVDVINQVNKAFIDKGVKFVIAVGDVTDDGSNNGLDTRAIFAQALYDAKIGFYPLRGNHEPSQAAATRFQSNFPQTQNGVNNKTPDAAWSLTNPDSAHQPFPAKPKKGHTFSVGSGFTSPSANLKGLSYAFTYENAMFMLLDQFTPTDGITNTIDNQQKWISKTLANNNAGNHTFVFGHKGLITEDHTDTLIGANTPSDDPVEQDAFISSLAKNGVRYYIGGHDHMHDRTVVFTPDAKTGYVTEIVSASDSSKFYTPKTPSNDDFYSIPSFGHTRQTPIAQELYGIGYYIYTVDGPRVTVDYYSVPSGQIGGVISTTPALTGHWVKRETFGYSLNGWEFLVPQGQTYTTVQDSFDVTAAQILSGTNGSTVTDGSGRPLVKAVNTGWTKKTHDVSSDILTLWGMYDIGATSTDTYTLAMDYGEKHAATDGSFGLAIKDAATGKWVNAVTKNAGGTKNFVKRAWVSGDTLGTYGIDTTTNTAWAVMNQSGDFAVTTFPKTTAKK